MKISNKLLVGYAMLGATLLGSTGASFYTVNNLKNDIEFITERAWEAADGSMNGIIALEADFIKIQKSYIEPAEALSLVNSEPVELNEAKESFERLVGAEFLTEEEDKKLHSLINKYESARLDVVNKIKANPFATPHINDFTNIAHELIEFVGVLEEEGDARIEEAIEHSHVSVSEFNYISIITLIAAIIISLISYAFTRRSIVVPINDLREKLKDITQGSSNLNVKIDVKSEDELGDLATYFNTFIEQLKGTISQSLKLSLETDDKASALSAAVEQTTGNITTIRSETETVASSINEMSTSIKEVAVNASDASDAAREAKNNVESGQKIIESTIDRLENIALEVGRTSDSISNLKAGSEQISSVIDVIKNIAEQTNLLALNAAIEAARAGEQGRGFAVVADEVRSLAIRTRTSTEEIESMILQLVEQTDQAVTNMAEGQKTVQVAVEESDGARESLRLIIDSVEAIADMSMHIASASEQQGAVSNDIAENVNRINDSTIESDEAMIHTRDVTIELARIASDLRDQLSRFI